MEKIDCEFLRLVLMALLSDESIKKKMDNICNECPEKSVREKAEKCLGKPPLTLEDIYEPDEEMR